MNPQLEIPNNPFEEESRVFKGTITFGKKGKLLFGGVCPTINTGKKGYVARTTYGDSSSELIKAYDLAKNLFSTTRRLSGEGYFSHLENTDGYYRFFTPNPTVSGRKIGFHHDSIEDFPEAIGTIIATIGRENAQQIIYLSKFNPKLLEEAEKYPQLFLSRRAVYEKVSRVVDSCEYILYAGESLRSMFQVAMVGLLWKSVMGEYAHRYFSFTQGSCFGPNKEIQETFLMGKVFHEIVESGDKEDIVKELALIKNLFEAESIDTLYIKLCERIDNLTSIEYLEQLCNSDSDKEKINKKMRARRKVLATSRVYLYIAREKLKDPKIYGALEYLIEWNEKKLDTFEETIERREKERAFIQGVLPSVTVPQKPS